MAVSSMSQTRWTTKNIPDNSGRTICITGANSGLGLEAARNLVGAGAHVILACRNVAKAEAAAQSLRLGTGNGTGSVEVRELDLASLASVRQFSEQLLTDGIELDGLMNNAGLMALDQSRTEDGFETQIGVNHLGHYALTGLLLPSLMKRPNSRIVNVSSMGHIPGKIHLDDLMCDRRKYNRWGAYFQSKLANILFTNELERRLRETSSTTIALAAHPGTARTELGKTGTSATNFVMRRVAPVMTRTGVQGCESQVRAMVDPSASGREYYGPKYQMFGAPIKVTPSKRARNMNDARRLWEISEELTGVSYNF
jgi:NAD(P)-dependent dehydrogenase (short-subunit alcohol dehydrogenase family)